MGQERSVDFLSRAIGSHRGSQGSSVIYFILLRHFLSGIKEHVKHGEDGVEWWVEVGRGWVRMWDFLWDTRSGGGRGQLMTQRAQDTWAKCNGPASFAS